jgi:hypothetical protein
VYASPRFESNWRHLKVPEGVSGGTVVELSTYWTETLMIGTEGSGVWLYHVAR